VADVDLDALERVVAKMTPGPWLVAGDGGISRIYDQNEYWVIVNHPLNTAGIVTLINAALALIAELRHLRGQTCETCRHQQVAHDQDGEEVPCCGKHRGYVACRVMGNGCRAWTPK